MQSIFFFIGIVIFFFVALAITNHIQRKKGNTKERETATPPINLHGGCCGTHEVCEKENLIATFEKEPEYFDDEELDKYVHCNSSEYAEKEAEEFRKVLYSLRDDEKHRWVKGLQARGIHLPDQIKDEVLMFINESKSRKPHA